MDYIVHRRFKDRGLCGMVNFPALTPCEEIGEMICYNGQPICYVNSENAHQFFARNDDGNGMLRGRLTQEIQKKLCKRDKHYQERWDMVWNDPTCKRYKRKEFTDFWLWNHDFFNADIKTLRRIANLVGVKEEKLNVPNY